jgi:hypothetical protein
VTLYKRWITSPNDEMPFWLRSLSSLVSGACGFIVSYSVGSGLGARLVLFAVVAGGITLGVGIVWTIWSWIS